MENESKVSPAKINTTKLESPSAPAKSAQDAEQRSALRRESIAELPPTDAVKSRGLDIRPIRSGRGL
jgi:hypothetical protein